ncbi:MAG: UDP-N-acetylmuramate:L-alanyl-gamma-D-glutamyl-meso-diaminopimelate ligase, partial [Desulfobacterales bacterium]|nr:UDP-N-acetylmuramate:L-alanyl-gamma-D-glutamyl-meso-diaminopimelate ligase [Desulfobacterales bacterium]
SNYRLGRGEYFVIEGDEYDTAFFHKVPKFVHYDASLSVLTSVEFDHADIYRDLDHVKEAFSEFIGGVPPGGTVAAYDEDENIDELIARARGRVIRYGRREDSFWRIGKVAVEPPYMVFELLKEGRSLGFFKTRMVGEHNLLNALAVIAISDVLGIPMESIGQALETFDGIKRRQEIRGEKRGVAVIDDFAHHPTAVRETVRAVKPFYPSGRLIAVFEPRTNTSMRDIFQDVYPESFDHADVICIRKPPLLKKIPSGERFSSEALVEDLKRRGRDAHFFESTGAIIEFLVETAMPGDAVLIMSNGGFDNIHERLLEAL